MKHAANSLTISRMILSGLLIFLIHRPACFIIFYSIAGLTDLLDGPIARKSGHADELGARLDSIADMIMFGVVTATFIVWSGPEIYGLLPYLYATLAIRILALLYAGWRFRTFAMIHTWGNKCTGLLVFAAPFVLLWPEYVPLVFRLVCILSLLSGIEELLIHLTSQKLDLNRKSLFSFGNSPSSPK